MNKKEMIINILISSIEKGDITGPIGVARLISELAHAGQYRDNGHCYFNHPHRCATMFYNLVSLNNNVNGEIIGKHDIPYGVLEVAYLHDVVEDTELTHKDIKDIFSEIGLLELFNRSIDVPLKLITHNKSEDYDTYIEKVMEHPVSSLVKMLDLTDNMNLFGLSELGDFELERVKRYADYFKRINDKWNFLETLKECFVDTMCAWNDWCRPLVVD